MTTQNPTLGKMSHRLSFLATLLLLFVVALSCSDDDDSETPPATPTTLIKAATSTTLGTYLTDGDGNTLYVFASDAAGENTCTGGCATLWPVFFAENLTQELLGDNLNLADFGTTSGGKQTTYKGWPLYYYAPSGTREAAGSIGGDKVGGVWFAAKPNYSIMLASAQLTGKDGKKYKSDYTEGEGNTTYFTDAKGRTLYTFKNDKKNTNTFSTAGDAIWPVYSESLGAVPSVLEPSLFGTITVAAVGKSQLTYKGWPLYYYDSDTKRGENKGVSVAGPGTWPVAVKDMAAATDPAPVTPSIVLGTDATFGSYLTDANNNTLYFFATDAAGANTCTGGCATLWPIFNAGQLTQEKLGQGLTLADFGTTAGGQQTTYKGWPLYYYAPGGTREAAGTIGGDKVGNVWFVAKPDYTIMIANAQLVGDDGKNYTSDYQEGTGKTQYFVNSRGMTLYAFKNDKNGQNTFTNGTAAHDSQWPVLVGPLDKIPSVLDNSLFGTTTITATNQTQLTYKGWPMYYYGKDASRGQNRGVSYGTPGTWPVITKDMAVAPSPN